MPLGSATRDLGAFTSFARLPVDGMSSGKVSQLSFVGIGVIAV